MKLNEIKVSVNLTFLIIGGLLFILLLGGGLTYHLNKLREKNIEIRDEIKLRNALTAEIKKYRNKENEWVSEKLTLQASLETLNKSYGNLSEIQKELLNRLNSVEKNQKIIAAGLVDVVVNIKNLTHDGDVEVDDEKNTILFADNKDNIEYSFLIGEVKKAYPLITPTLNIQSIKIPNRQEVKFFWDNDKKEGYPISFSVVNSNPYIEIIGMESYAIPGLVKEDIDPTRWEQFIKWSRDNKKTLINLGGASLIGVGVGVFLMK